MFSDNLIVPGILPDNQGITPYSVAKGVWNGPKQKTIEQIVSPKTGKGNREKLNTGNTNTIFFIGLPVECDNRCLLSTQM